MTDIAPKPEKFEDVRCPECGRKLAVVLKDRCRRTYCACGANDR